MIIVGNRKYMEIIRIPEFKYTSEQMDRIVDCFSRGGVVAYPTDTVYGIGCIVSDHGAIKRIYKIKQRDRSKPLLRLVSDMDMAREYFVINKEQQEYLSKYWPGPVSFLLKPHKRNEKGGVAVRLPKNDFLIRMIKRVGEPITSTSLNISGDEVLTDVSELEGKLDVSRIDMLVDAGPISAKPSSIVDLRDINNIKTIRE